MKRFGLGIAAVLAVLGCAASAGAVELKGAGATFPAPLYYAWIDALKEQAPDLEVRYDSVGSGEGVRRFVAAAVDFGASDAIMTDEQIAAVEKGVVSVPATAGMVVIIYNVEGLQQGLRLSRDTLTGIFSGAITEWNDPKIKADNPGVDLPDRTISIVVRRDGSGTTSALTTHLSAISPAWKDEGPGIGTLVDWPGSAMTAYGNDGVAGRVKISYDSIGYVEYGYARRLGLPMAAIQNNAGSFVEPSGSSGAAALSAVADEMPADGRQLIPDPKGADAYPIVTYSWLLLYKDYADKAVQEGLHAFVAWGLDQGQTMAEDLGYVPLPAVVVEKSKALLATVN